MSRVVIDASVAVKWFLPEEDSDAARAILRSGHDLLAPDLLYAEVGSVLNKRSKRGEFDQADGLNMLRSLVELRIVVRPHQPLAEAAWAICTRYGQSFYDSLYLALALGSEARFVTADKRFFNALKDTPLAPHMAWVSETV